MISFCDFTMAPMDSIPIIIPVLLSYERRCFVNLNKAARYRTDPKTTVSEMKESDFTGGTVTDRLIATFLLHSPFLQDSSCFSDTAADNSSSSVQHLSSAHALGLVYLQSFPCTGETQSSGKLCLQSLVGSVLQTLSHLQLLQFVTLFILHITRICSLCAS